MISWPEQLINSLARRRAIIQIGSGVSANASTREGRSPKTWREFLDQALSSCGPGSGHMKKAIKRGDLLTACEFVRSRLGEDWYRLLRAEFGEPNYRPAPIHEAIYNIDSRIVLSTNFDRIYDNYAITASEQTIVIKHHTDDDIGMLIYGDDRYIIKLHGSIDAPRKMIFTASDYAEARTKYRSFYSIVDSLISTSICLLIGSGLEDPDIKMLFEDYKSRTHLIPHYILLPKPLHADEVALVKATRGLNVILYSSKNNHKELTDGLFRLAELVEGRRAGLADSLSW
jgi:hypothetical protein